MNENLKDLLALIERAAGGSRELDAELWWHLVADKASTYGDIAANIDNIGVAKSLDRAWGRSWRAGSYPGRVSASIDASIALKELLLPEFKGYEIIEFEYEKRVQACVGDGMHSARTAPLAILGSLLKALIASDPAGRSDLSALEGGEQP